MCSGLYEEVLSHIEQTCHLSDQAVKASRKCVESKYGVDYLSDKPRQF